jgi:DNA-binding transcriptional LysR family regulator
MGPDLELRQLRIFVAVVEAETLTRAAHSLGVAQSTVSENIASLERALGTRVFSKNGRSLGLTDEGKALVPYAQKMLSLEREARAGLAAVGDRASSTLVLGTVESVSAYLLPPLVTALQQTWPKLRVSVETGSCADVRRRAKSGEVDVGLVLEREGRTRTDERVLLRTPLVCFKAPRATSAGFDMPSAEALRKGVFFFSDRAGAYHQILRDQFRSTGFPAPSMNGLGTIEAVKRTVMQTAGAYGVLPGFAVAEELQSNQFEIDRVAAVRAGRQGPLAPVVHELFERLETAVPSRGKEHR